MDLTLRHWIYLGALVALLLLFQRLKGFFWIFSLAILPGTFCHELCHLCVGGLLNGKPARFTLMPHREGTIWVMGSVAFSHVRWYNAFFLGLAPLLLLPAAWALLTWRLRGASLAWSELLLAYVIANLVYASLPSWQDLRVAARSPVGWVLLGAALVYGWFQWQDLGPTSGLYQLEIPGLSGGHSPFRNPGQHIGLGQAHEVG